jgi:hypothetical protein
MPASEQAMRMPLFYIMPSILPPGFMFPFRGMHDWAQMVGTAIPATHFLRVVRSALLRGEGLATLWPRHVALTVVVCTVTAPAMLGHRRTQDQKEAPDSRGSGASTRVRQFALPPRRALRRSGAPLAGLALFRGCRQPRADIPRLA